MERAMGIEPTPEAWEAAVLPLNYARNRLRFYSKWQSPRLGGFKRGRSEIECAHPARSGQRSMARGRRASLGHQDANARFADPVDKRQQIGSALALHHPKVRGVGLGLTERGVDRLPAVAERALTPAVIQEPFE